MDTLDSHQAFETAKYFLTQLYTESQLLVGQLRHERSALVRSNVLQRLREIRYRVFTSYCCGGQDFVILCAAMQFAGHLGSVLARNGIHEEMSFTNRGIMEPSQQKEIILG